MKTRVDRLRHEAGFTIIEVMVASLLLVLGVLAVTTMVNNANAVTDTTRAREGATNLARQLLEVTRTQQYSRLDNSNLASLLQAAGVSDDSAASGWQVNRRKVTYTVNSYACIFDAAKDGARTQSADAAAQYCPGSATPVADNATSGKDNAPDDYRRVEFTVTWTRQGTTPDCNGQTTGSQLSTTNVSTGIGRACVTQSELIPNPTGGLGPDIQTINYDPACCTVGTGTDLGAIEQNTGGQMVFTVTTTSPADQVLWRADDTVSSGSATQVTPTDFKTWTFTYTYPTNPPLLDGPHTLTVQAFLASVSGVPKPYVINLNRNIPPAPNTQFTNVNNGAMSAVGVNTRLTAHQPPQVGDTPIVEVNWNQVGDGDIVGYTAYKTIAPAPIWSPSVDTVACPTGSSTLTGATETSCADTNAPAITALPAQVVNYYIVAFDNRWTVRTNPTVYSAAPLAGQAQCPLLSANLGVNLTLFNPASIRPGCPSALIPIDINQASQLPRPTLSGTVTKDTTNGVALDWPDATPVNASTPIQFYRVYRNPASLTTPQVSERYSRSGTSSFIDPSPSATCDTYAVTAVDSNWQESDPISVTCP